MYFVICSCTCHSLAISRRCFFLKIFPPYVSSLLINVTIYCIFPEQKVIGNVRSRPPPLSWNNPSSCLEQLILLLQFYRAGKAEKWTRRREGERRQCRVRLEEEDGQSFLFLLRPPPPSSPNSSLPSTATAQIQVPSAYHPGLSRPDPVAPSSGAKGGRCSLVRVTVASALDSATSPMTRARALV
jgi:hypothetical protein